MPSLKQRLLDLLMALVLVVVGAVSVEIYHRFFDTTTPSTIQKAEVNSPVIAQPSKVAAGKPAVSKPIKSKTVKVLPEAVKNKSTISDTVKDDPNKQVVASSLVQPDSHAHTITTLIDTETGAFLTFDNKEPSPWFAWNHKTDIGVFAGLKNGITTGRIELRQSLFDIKALHFGGIATVDQPLSSPLGTDYFIGLGAWY